MKIVFFTAALVLSINVTALEVGDVYQQDAKNLVHLLPDNTMQVAHIDAKAKGHNKLFIEFFQTTCSACIANRPKFIDLSNKFGSVATFKLVGMDRKESLLRSFFEKIKTEFNFPYVLDHNRVASKAFKVNVTPTSFILDINGKILYKHEGIFSESDKAKIAEILKAN